MSYETDNNLAFKQAALQLISKDFELNEEYLEKVFKHVILFEKPIAKC
jgi:hypothetical protein